jgi:vancomycin permeability regulator SanA
MNTGETEGNKKNGGRKKWWWILLCAVFIIALPSSYLMINAYGGNKFFERSNISTLPLFSKNSEDLESSENSPEKNTSVIIVFGAGAPYNIPSAVFADRLTVASELYFSGKSSKILVSGDNSKESYNEPQTGKNFLEGFGVPPEDIVLDYAGFRTYDTCVRAKEIFGVDQAYLVTQQFHLPRAIFLCEQSGIESVGVSASLRDYAGTIKNLMRESIAHQVTFYEMFLFRHDPKFLGEKEFIFEE